MPVFFGSTANGNGVRRLLKALRHDTPEPKSLAAARLGLSGNGAYVLKISHAGQAGKLALCARVRQRKLNDSDQLTHERWRRLQRPGALFSVQRFADEEGIDACRRAMSSAIGKLDPVAAGDLLSSNERRAEVDQACRFKKRFPVYQLAIATKDRKDDVRLVGCALQKLVGGRCGA